MDMEEAVLVVNVGRTLLIPAKTPLSFKAKAGAVAGTVAPTAAFRTTAASVPP